MCFLITLTMDTKAGISKIQSLGFSGGQRALMFYGICFPLRMSAAYAVTRYGNRFMIKVLVVLSALFSISNNFKTHGSGTWWHRKFHLVNSIILLISATHGTPQTTGTILAADILYGILLSIYKRPFRRA